MSRGRVASAVRKSGGEMTKRSVLAVNGQLSRGWPVTRATSLRSKPRGRNTDRLVCSATETRDIGPLSPQITGVSGPRPEDSEGLAGGQLWIARKDSSDPLETDGKEAVEAGHARIRIGELAGQGPQLAGRRENLVYAIELRGGNRPAAEPGIAGEEIGHDLDAFRGLERADAIDQQATRPEQLGRTGQHRPLQHREGGDVVGLLAPRYVRMAPHGSGRRARRIEEDSVELGYGPLS